ncbi:MAG: group II intron reverse transcriptase/maturase [Gemmatimonadetes bacterium]|nr:group II intron reverse transcriptase/maturase [Gemmatimonadota bacterium]
MDERDAGKRAERLERAGRVGGGTAEGTGAARQAFRAPGEQAGDETVELMEEVLRRENLMAAYRRVVRNKGAGGVDGRSVDDLKHQIREDWPTIREALLSGTYEPSPVRKVEIPKPGGGVRMLGIPTVMDRMIQQALLQVLTPIFDPTFSEDSYGFRPGRSTHQAVSRGKEHVEAGHRWVVDLDLAKFFDRVNHDVLMSRVARRVKDKRVLRVIGRYLRAGIMEDGVVSPRAEGTPQGGPLSPLLSNVLLDDLDKELERRGHRFVRYADDFQVYVKSKAAGERVMASVSAFITHKLKLRINQAKSRVAPAWEREFLGFSVTRGAAHKRSIGKKAMRRFKERIREITRRNRGVSLAHVVSDLTQFIRGWIGYFGFCEAIYVLRDLDSWIRRRLRCFIWKQWKTFKRRRKGLMERGIAEAPASQTAARSRGCWSTSNVPPLRRAFPIAYFNALGLPRMFVRPRA